MTIKRKMFMDAVLIGNGIVVPVVRTESAMEAYRRQQFECSHNKRDPKGTCYHCGHRELRPIAVKVREANIPEWKGGLQCE